MARCLCRAPAERPAFAWRDAGVCRPYASVRRTMGHETWTLASGRLILNLSCVFCSVTAGVTDPGVCLAVNNEFVVFPALHQRPNNRGHMLLVPADHFGGIAEVPAEKAAPMLAALQVTTQAVKAAFGATGTTVRLNLGPPAQDIFHLHWHIIPRYVGDDFNSSKSSELPLNERLQLAAKLSQHLPRQAPAPARK